MLDHIFNLTPTWTIFASTGIVILILVVVINEIHTERRIQALGGHAPVTRSPYFLGIDRIYYASKAAREHNLYPFFKDALSKWGNTNNPHTFESYVANQRAVITDDPENIKAVLATQFKDFGKGEPFHEDWKEFLGDSIFATDGDLWHTSRQLIRPQFIKDRVSDLHTFERHLVVLLKELAATPDGIGRGKEVDITGLFFRYTLDAATEFLLGRSVGSLENRDDKFAIAFGEVQRIQTSITRLGPFKFLFSRRQLRRELKIINDFIEPFIDDALQLSPAELATKTKSDVGYTFLHAIAAYTRDRQMLRDQIIAVLLAGRDTTACTLSWLFYELAHHPEVVYQLRNEIINSIGLERAPTYADLKNMKYLQHNLNEILRLYPVVPYNTRMALRDTTLPHGGGPDGNQPIGILKDTRIAYLTMTMQRRPDLMPPPSPTNPPADVFSPARWESWYPKPWSYIPFNGGPRICVGQQFALTEVAYTVVRILQKFERIENFMLPEGEGVGMRGKRPWGDGPCMKAEIVLQPGEGVQVGFHEAAKPSKVEITT